MTVVALVAFAVLAAAQIAIPLAGHHAGLSTIVVVAMAVAVIALAVRAWGPGRALRAGTAVTGLALLAEVVGTRTGWPFGTYRYTGILQPTIGGVPAIVPLAWLGMGVAGWELAGRVATATTTRIAVGAVLLTGWDLFLDPQMTRDRFWVWPGGGVYRSIPLSNYAGWLACSVAVMAVLAALTGRHRMPPSSGLAALYTWMVVMETIGFVVFFGDPLVGVVGAAVTGPPTAYAWTR